MRGSLLIMSSSEPLYFVLSNTQLSAYASQRAATRKDAPLASLLLDHLTAVRGDSFPFLSHHMRNLSFVTRSFASSLTRSDLHSPAIPCESSPDPTLTLHPPIFPSASTQYLPRIHPYTSFCHLFESYPILIRRSPYKPDAFVCNRATPSILTCDASCFFQPRGSSARSSPSACKRTARASCARSCLASLCPAMTNRPSGDLQFQSTNSLSPRTPPPSDSPISRNLHSPLP